VGVWQPARGKIWLNARTFDQWSSEVLGTNIGYLPQGAELLGGTVAKNIARLEPEAGPQGSSPQRKRPACVNSSPSFPKYETQVGERGEMLSADRRNGSRLPCAAIRS
jgi:ATP-binding cassette subfamily C protein